MRNVFWALIFFTTASLASAETLHLVCEPRNEREEPYRTFNITIYDADTRDETSEISYAMYSDKDASTPNSAGILDGFARNETFSTQLTSRYRQIRIEGGKLGLTWQRDTLQLRKRRDTEYRGSFEFPEGSEQLDLGWNSSIGLVCERTL